MLKKKALVAVPVLLVLALILFRVSARLAEGPGDKAKSRRTPVVSVVEVTRRDLEEVHQSVGTVESPQRVALSPKASGRIEELEVQPGDRVRKGQVLVRLDRDELQDQVDQRQAQLAEARSRLAQARLAQAPAEASVSRDLRQQEAAVATAEADLVQVRQSGAASVAAAEAGVDNARAQEANARARLERVEELYRQAFTAAQDVDDARTQAAVARGQLRAAEEALRSARAQARADLAAAEAHLAQARASLDLARASTANTPAYQQNLAALQAVVEAAEAALDSARSHLADTDLVSPLDGYVTERHLDPGALAQAGQAILTLQSTRELWVTVPVPAEVRERLEVRSPARVELEGGTTVEARILRINAAADPQSRQFEVRVLLPASAEARPGVFARVTLVVAQAKRALAVPRSALRTTPDGPVLAVVTAEGKVRLQPVSLGLATPGFTQVLDGAKEGDRVITLGAANLEDGQEVKVDEGETAPEAGNSPGAQGSPKAGGSTDAQPSPTPSASPDAQPEPSRP